MKKLIVEDATDGLENLLGQYVTLYCNSFIYAGILKGVSATCALLESAEIVYDTGSHQDREWATAEKLPGEWYVSRHAIESFGVFKHGK